MRRKFICAGQWFVALLLLAMGSSFQGCKDTVSISEDVAVPLASLTVTPGNLQPAFFSNTTNYTVNAPTSADSVTVTAAPRDSTVTMTINGTVTAAGQGRSVPLGTPGSTTTITIVLEAQNGSDTTYTVNVTRLLSSDNNLSNLTVTPGPLAPPFTSSTLDYTVNVATNVLSVTISATKSDPNAAMSGSVIAGAGTATGQATIPLGGPGTATPVTITVIAPNGIPKTYTITVNRAAPSSNNNLSVLTVTPGPLDPAFASGTLIYTVNVATNVTSVGVSATKADPDAVMSGDVTAGTGTALGQATIPLNGPGTSKVVSITVIAPSGVFKTYTITVNRAASSDDTLLALTVTANNVVQPLAPDFNANIQGYTVNVANTVDQVTVAATKSDPNAVMAIGSVTVPAGTASGSAPNIPLSGPGTQTVVSISVTAQSGGVPKLYTITVNRATPAAPPAPIVAPDLIPEDDSCVRFPIINECIPPTSEEDNITNITTPRFEIPQPGAGETPNLYVNGVKVGSDFDPAANTLKPTAPLSDGTHPITYTVANGGSPESAQSPPLTVTIDTSSP